MVLIHTHSRRKYKLKENGSVIQSVILHEMSLGCLSDSTAFS